ncbi:MAG: tetratricopeptide repeat protein [Pseudomonadota bacterium]
MADASSGKILEVNLFGACVVRAADGVSFEITGAKHKAMFALLATAPFGRRTRAFLQDTLWGTACYDSGRQSLRRALSDVKGSMGDAFNTVLTATNAELTLDLTKVKFVGRPGGGEFLEGLNIKEAGFQRWLEGMRADPTQIDALFSLSSQAPQRPVLPVVAVIPFRTIAGGNDQQVLGDWLAEEIARSLARSNLMSVISHLSSRRMVASNIDIEVIREKLGADFLVSGSLRPDGDGIALDADFLDLRTGQILWTRRFSGTLGDFLSRDAPGLSHIIRTVGASIADDAIRHTAGRTLASIEDHRLLSAGVGLMHRTTLRDFARSRELLHEAIRRAPRAAEAHAWLGKWHVLSVFNGWTSDPALDTAQAIDATARALDIDPDSTFALTVDGFAHNNLLKRIDIAASRYSEALRYNPNEALSWLLKGMLHAFTDNAEEAVTFVERARTLSPMDPFGYFFDSLSASAYLAAEQYELALRLADRSIATNDRHLSTIRAKITALHFLGRTSEARDTGLELMRRQPDCSVSSYLRDHPAANFNLGKNVAEAMSAAGIP